MTISYEKMVANRTRNFWLKVNKTPTCWLWTAGVSKDSYGKFIHFRAHRFSYELHKGPIPEGLSVLHTCDAPLCVNPDHLFAGTQLDNMQDMANKGRRPLGEKCRNAKVTEEQVREIRTLYAGGETTYKALSLEFGLSIAGIHFIVSRRNWKHIE